jgi:hypothetical protein
MGSAYRHAGPAVVAAVLAVLPPQPSLGQSETTRLPAQAALPLLPATPVPPPATTPAAVVPPVQLPAFLDDRRLRQIENAREAVEAEVKRKAEAERQRLAEEEKKRLAEEEAKRKAEEMRQKVAEEAEERRKARKLTRQLEKMREAAQVQAEQQASVHTTDSSAAPPRHTIASVAVPAAAAGAAAVTAGAAKPGACGAPKITSLALPAGRMSIAVEAPCRAGETVRLGYGPYTFHHELDGKGQHLHVLDLFLGAAQPVNLTFADDSSETITVEAHDLDKVSKVAIVWTQQVDLDLHALEYTAARNGEGHVSAANPSSVEAVVQRARERARGAGFMSAVADGRAQGHKVEVYTFWHVDKQEPGVVGLAVDYVTRGALPAGEYCGQGPNAEVTFEALVLSKGRMVSRERTALGSAACGKPMLEDARYNMSAVPHLKVQ